MTQRLTSKKYIRSVGPTIKNFLFAVTRPTQKICLYPKYFIVLPEKDFFLFHVLRFSFSISSVFPFKDAKHVL